MAVTATSQWVTFGLRLAPLLIALGLVVASEKRHRRSSGQHIAARGHHGPRADGATLRGLPGRALRELRRAALYPLVLLFGR